MPAKIYIGTLTGHVGQEFKVGLWEQCSAGYLWTARFDSAFLKKTTDQLLPNYDNSIGGPLLRDFRFQFLAPGNTEVEFIHARPWLGGAVMEHQAFKIIIKPAP